MKVKSNKGYVGMDVGIAILVLLVLVPTIAGMIYNVNKTNSLIDRKTEAISIAVNTIESAKGELVEDLTSEKVKEQLIDIYTDCIISDITDPTETTDKKVLTVTKGENTYRIQIEIQDYSKLNRLAEENKVKIATVIVEFKSGKEQKEINLNTVIS